MLEFRNIKWYLCLKIYISLLAPTWAQFMDSRIITYEDLKFSIDQFNSTDVDTFSELMFDIPHYQLIVGARNYIFRLKLEGLQVLEKLYWPPTVEDRTMCQQKGQTEEDCHNFIRVLVSHNNKIFVCGTNAFSPQCSWREFNSLETIHSSLSGVAKCPYSPHNSNTVLMTIQGDYYIGSALDFSAQDYAISRVMGKGPLLRTIRFDIRWLNEPKFKASFEIGNFVYFFFQEIASETMNCGKVTYSRIARVCKNDQGGHVILKDNWTTYLKARLNCTSGGKHPVYFDEIQSIYFLEQEQLFYATFTAPEELNRGSAICAYNISAISRTFDGPFKFQSNPKSTWEQRYSSSKHFQCFTPASEEDILNSQKFQLMYEAVQPLFLKPLYSSQTESMVFVVADVVPTKTDPIHVVFTATTTGIVKKLAKIPLTSEMCLVEELNLFPNNSSQKILTMKIFKETSSLYFGTNFGVYRISLHRCHRFKSKRECLSSMDPYCGWNNHQQACTTAIHPLNSNWEQDPISCINFKIEALPQKSSEWSEWSEWNSCSSVCGNGFQSRQRECRSFHSHSNENVCIGCNQEWRKCNEANCAKTTKAIWTPWLYVNGSKEGCIKQQRFYITCHAQLTEDEKIVIVANESVETTIPDENENCSEIVAEISESISKEESEDKGHIKYVMSSLFGGFVVGCLTGCLGMYLIIKYYQKSHNKPNNRKCSCHGKLSDKSELFNFMRTSVNSDFPFTQ